MSHTVSYMPLLSPRSPRARRHTTPHHVRAATLHHTAPHHAAPHRTAPHRTAPHRTAPHRTAPHRTAPHRTAPRYALPKALVLRDRLHAIIPNARIDARVSMFKKREADLLLDIDVPPGHCFVLDCIDDLATKAELIEQCSRRGLRVLSSMGAGLKSDPTRLHIAKLADCSKDRLAMRVRCFGGEAGDGACVLRVKGRSSVHML